MVSGRLLRMQDTVHDLKAYLAQIQADTEAVASPGDGLAGVSSSSTAVARSVRAAAKEALRVGETANVPLRRAVKPAQSLLPPAAFPPSPSAEDIVTFAPPLTLEPLRSPEHAFSSSTKSCPHLPLTVISDVEVSPALSLADAPHGHPLEGMVYNADIKLNRDFQLKRGSSRFQRLSRKHKKARRLLLGQAVTNVTNARPPKVNQWHANAYAAVSAATGLVILGLLIGIAIGTMMETARHASDTPAADGSLASVVTNFNQARLLNREWIAVLGWPLRSEVGGAKQTVESSVFQHPKTESAVTMPHRNATTETFPAQSTTETFAAYSPDLSSPSQQTSDSLNAPNLHPQEKLHASADNTPEDDGIELPATTGQHGISLVVLGGALATATVAAASFLLTGGQAYAEAEALRQALLITLAAGGQ